MPFEKLTDSDRSGFASKTFVDSVSKMSTSLVVYNENIVKNTAVVKANTDKVAHNSNIIEAEIIEVKAERVEPEKPKEQPWLMDVNEWLKKISNSLTRKQSPEALRKKEEAKASKLAEKEKQWKSDTKRWRKGLLNNVTKTLTDNPVANFFKDHWGKLLLVFSFMFLKPSEMKKVWYAIKDGMMWLWDNGPDIAKGIWTTIEVLFQIGKSIVMGIKNVVEWLWNNIMGRKVTDEDVVRAENRKEELKSKERYGLLSNDERDELENELSDEKIDQMKTDRDEFKRTGKRQGGLLGDNRGIAGIFMGVVAAITAFGIALAAATVALALMTASMVPMMGGFKGIGKLFKKKPSRGPKVRSRADQKVRDSKVQDRKKVRDQKRQARRDAKTKAKLDSGPKQSKVGGVKKAKIWSNVEKTPKALPAKTPTASAPKAPTAKPITAKPPSGMSTTTTGASKMSKWASKFPKLAGGMKFLKKIPGPVGKAFTTGPILMALASGADKKTVLPMIGASLGGIGGGFMGTLLGGMIGAAGGPVAIVTGMLGGIIGGMLGDRLGMGIAQWLVGDTVDALPFDWMNDLLNGGKGPDEGGDLKKTPKDTAKETAPPPDSSGKTEKLPKGSKPKAPQFKIDTFMLDDDSDPNTLKAAKAAEDMVNQTRQKAAKIKPGKVARTKKREKKQKNEVWGKLGRAMRTMPMDVRMLVHEGLTDEELKMMDYGAWDDKRKSTMTDAEIEAVEAKDAANLKKSSGISGSADFMGELEPATSPTDKVKGMKNLEKDRAELESKGQGTTIVKGGDTSSVNVDSGSKQTIVTPPWKQGDSKTDPYLQKH